MAVRQRGAKWQVDVTVNGVRHSCTCATEQEANIAEAKMRYDMLLGVPAADKASKGWTFKQAFDRCMEQVWHDTPHAANVKKQWKPLSSHFGEDTPLNAITVNDIDDYCQGMRKRSKANGTINRHMATLSRMFTYAMERKELSLVTSKPHIQKYKESEGRTKFFTHAEEHAIVGTLRHLGYPEQADFIEFLIDTGARVESDGLSLPWSRVDLDAGMVVFSDRKAGNTTGIPLTARVKEILKARLEKANGSALVWPYKYWWLRGPWARTQTALGKDGDPEWIPHTCRHTTASRLVQAGVPLKAVQEFMGHATLSQTQRYAHLAPAALLPCAQALQKATDANPLKTSAG